MELARRILGAFSRGIEIGASAFNPFPGVRAWNVDTSASELFQQAQRELAGKVAPIDVLASADALPFVSETLEFVLASHVIEHMPDTIRALGEWDRVLQVGGVCFLIVPHKERTMDRDRPRTELGHHLADYALRTSVASDSMVPTSHYHVWITADFVALVEFLNAERFLDWAIETVEDVDSKVGNGFTVVARKRSRPRPRASAGSAEVVFHLLTPDLPFQMPMRSLEVLVPGAELPARPPVPRGRWRVAPIHAGFPPRAGPVRVLELGDAIDPPRLESARWDGTALLFGGRHLNASTWLEARYPGGVVHRVLPELRGAELCVDLAGLVVPDEPFQVVAINPPPGGGRSEPIWTPRPPRAQG